MSKTVERAPETLLEKLTASTPLMLIVTLSGVVGGVIAVAGGYYTVFRLVTFLGN